MWQVQRVGGAIRFLGGVLALTGLGHVLLTLGFFCVKDVVQHAGGILWFSLVLGLVQSWLGGSLIRAGTHLRGGEIEALVELRRPLYGLGLVLLLVLGSLLLLEGVLWLITWAPVWGGCC